MNKFKWNLIPLPLCFPLIIKHSNWINIQGRIFIRYSLGLNFRELSKWKLIWYEDSPFRKSIFLYFTAVAMEVWLFTNLKLCKIFKGGKSSRKKTFCGDVIITVQPCSRNCRAILVEILVKAAIYITPSF